MVGGVNESSVVYCIKRITDKKSRGSEAKSKPVNGCLLGMRERVKEGEEGQRYGGSEALPLYFIYLPIPIHPRN